MSRSFTDSSLNSDSEKEPSGVQSMTWVGCVSDRRKLKICNENEEISHIIVWVYECLLCSFIVYSLGSTQKGIPIDLNIRRL